MSTHVVPKPISGELMTIAIPIASTTRPAGAKSLSPRTPPGERCGQLVGALGPLGAQREDREQEPAADPEDGDADVDELEDRERMRGRVGRLEGEDEADGDERERDGRR